MRKSTTMSPKLVTIKTDIERERERAMRERRPVDVLNRAPTTAAQEPVSRRLPPFPTGSGIGLFVLGLCAGSVALQLGPFRF